MPTRTWATAPAGVAAAIESATYVVAASDSQDPTRADAAYRCDGVSDQAEINAAIAALPAAGGIVHLLEGTYNIDASILIQRSNVMLVGDGWGTELHVQADIHGIHVGDGATALIEIKIGDLRINGTDQPGAVNVKGIFVEGGSGHEIDRVEIFNTCIHNYYQVGIRCDYMRYSVIHDNVGYSNDLEFILIYEGCEENVVTANISNADGIGIACYGTDNTRNLIHGNFISNSDKIAYSGIYLDLGTGYNSVCNNYIYGGSGDAIYTTQFRNLISGNYIYDPGKNGIILKTGDYCTVTGNHIDSASLDGIALEDTTVNNIISGNHLLRNGAYGIDIEAGCNNNQVLNNKYYGNTTAAIRDLGTSTMLPEIHVNSIFDDADVNVTLANIGDHVALSMADAVDSTLRFNFRVPSDFQELVRARLVIVPAASGNLRRAVATDFGACDEVYNLNTDAIADGTVAGLTINQLECLDLDDAFTGIVAGDHVGVAFTRNATHAEDTIEDVVYVLEFWMQYV